MSGRISTVSLALVIPYLVVTCYTLNLGTRTTYASQDGSHALQFGDLSLAKNHLAFFMGASGKSVEKTGLPASNDATHRRVEQRDADLIHFERLASHPDPKKRDERPLKEAKAHRLLVDNAVSRIGRLLFGDQYQVVANSIRPPTKALVDDWDCLKSMVAIFENRCGPLKQYGMKHMRVFANFCNAHVGLSQLDEVAKITCQLENPLA